MSMQISMMMVGPSGVGGRAGLAGADGEVVEMEEHFDQPGAAEVVESEESASQCGDETVGRFVGQPRFEVGGQLAAFVHSGLVSDGRFGCGDVLDLFVDGGVDRSVESR